MGQCGLISQLACDRMRFYIATNAWFFFYSIGYVAIVSWLCPFVDKSMIAFPS
jgi:hypothetical protein